MNNQITHHSKILSLSAIHLPTSFYPLGEVAEEFHLKKRSVMKYRLSFLALGIAFIVMSLLLSLKTPNWMYSMLFGYGWPLKTVFTSLTLALALSSLWLGCYLRTEHELVKEYVKRSQSYLKRLFAKKNTEIRLSGLSFNEKNLQEHLLRLAYQEASEEIEKTGLKIQPKLDLIDQDRGKLESQKISSKLALIGQFKNDLEKSKRQFGSYFPS